MTDKSLSMVIMAAGQSRRYGRLKQLEGFGPQGQPILFYTLFDAVRAGVGRAILVISEANRSEFEIQVVEPWSSVIDIQLVVQRLEDLPVIPFNGPGPAARSKPWGTGHAVWAVRDAVQGPFILANADDFYGRKAIAAVADFLESNSGPNQWALQAYELGATLPDDKGYNRGICRLDENGFLQSITEELDVKRNTSENLDQWVSMNLWGLGPGVFGLLENEFTDFLSHHGHDPECEFFLPDALASGLVTDASSIKVLPPVDGWLGVTYPEDASRVRQQLAQLLHENIYPKDLYS